MRITGSCLQIVKAFVVLTQHYREHDPELLKTDIMQHVKRLTAAYKYPRQVYTCKYLLSACLCDNNCKGLSFLSRICMIIARNTS